MTSYNRPTDDFDSFIDYNGGFDAANFADDNQTFSGPSHEYDRFRQQTGLPAGSMANVSAYNDMNMDNDFTSPTDYRRSGRSTSDGSGHHSTAGFDMDFDQTPQSATCPEFYPQSSNMADFSINPTAVYEQPRPVRMYPGMHTQQAQQAEQAKAAALAKDQQIGQSFQPSQPNMYDQAQSASKGKARAGSHQVNDPVADRRISEILDNMRHKGAMSPVQEDGQDANSEAAAKAKREEEEMDEDERLLASEEGKKLSSKERRQLRNKVSARAFRSRRKEYISQLEGDLNTKASETNDLKLFNRKLLEENNQLKNLTRTLLSHPAFQTFLEDMSRNQTFLAGPAPQHMHMPAPVETVPSQPQPQPQSQSHPIKQEPGQGQQQQQQQQQDQTQVNMARMPDSSLDMSMLNLGNNHWGSQTNGFSFQQPQVFAVFDLPQGPSMEEMRSSRDRRALMDSAPSSAVPLAAAPTEEVACTPMHEATAMPDSMSSDLARSTFPDYSFATLNRRLDERLRGSRSLHTTVYPESTRTLSTPTFTHQHGDATIPVFGRIRPVRMQLSER